MRALLMTLATAGVLAALGAAAAQGTEASGRIVFQSYAPSPTGNVAQLFTVNSDGTGLKQITTIPAAAGDPNPGAWAPAWFPDGSKIVFLSDYQASTGRPVHFFVVHSDGGALRKLKLRERGLLGRPAFAPHGKRIAFNANDQLYIANLATHSVRHVDPKGLEFDEGSPTWSPNGKWIAFDRLSPGTGLAAIFVIRPNGTGLRRVTAWNLGAGGPAWSPTGKRIVFDSGQGDSNTSSISNLYTIRPNGTGLTKLTHFTGNGLGAITPAWSPDGTQIVYSAPGETIWIMNANGSNPHQLAHLQYPAGAPAWSPAPR